MTACECRCFECRVNRHDICRHVIKCIKRPRSETYWGEPTTDEQRALVDAQQDAALFNLIAYGV